METQKKWMTVTGWVLTALPILGALIPSAIFKFQAKPEMVASWTSFGFQPSTLLPIAVTEAACVIVHLIPKTTVLGAILLTGYLGGAVLTHVRMGQPQFFGAVIVGVLIWGGLFLREPRVRALIPFKS
jgi:hypothetical protein